MASLWDTKFRQVAPGTLGFVVAQHFNSTSVLAHVLQAGIGVLLYVGKEEGFQKHILHVDPRLRRLSASPDLHNPIASINQTKSFPIHHISSILSGQPAMSFCLQHGVKDELLDSKTALVVLPAAQYKEEVEGLHAFIPRVTREGLAVKSRHPTQYANQTLNAMLMIVPSGRLRLKRCMEAVIAIAPGAITSQDKAARIIQMHRRALSIHRAIQLQGIGCGDPGLVLTGNPTVELSLSFLPVTEATVSVKLRTRADCDIESARVQQDYALVAADGAQLKANMRELLSLQKWLLDLVPEVFQADGLKRLVTDSRTIECTMLADGTFMDAQDRMRREVQSLMQSRDLDEGLEFGCVRSAVIALENMLLLEEEFSEVAQRVQAAGGVERPPVVDLEGKIRNLGPTLKLHAARPPDAAPPMEFPLQRSRDEILSRENTKVTLQSEATSRHPVSAGWPEPRPTGDVDSAPKGKAGRVSIDPAIDGGPRLGARVPQVKIGGAAASPGVSPRTPAASGVQEVDDAQRRKMGRHEGLPCIGPQVPCNMQ
mmetsp:Transcript_4477/g.9814  ORF Transcript_4477/g.9814 Transcript_4477/m.9814 type:complete len:541 (+) Transcript_4477:111-1733(+)